MSHLDDCIAAGLSAAAYDKRYADRSRDLHALLAEELPPRTFALPGYLESGRHGLLTGPGGAAKTIFAVQSSIQATQEDPAEFPFDLEMGVDLNRVTIIDAEMGREQYNRQIKDLGLAAYVHPARINYVDAAGLDLAHPSFGHLDLEYIVEQAEGSDLVILDSLKRLTRSAAENDTDAMSAVVDAVTQTAHDTGLTFLTIHHWGWSERRLRGASSILDAADAVFGWGPPTDDEDSKHRALISRGKGFKVRGMADQADRWFEQQDSGLLLPAEAPVKKEAGNEYDALIAAMLPFDGSKNALAKAVGTTGNNSSFIKAYARVACFDTDAAAHVVIAREEPAI